MDEADNDSVKPDKSECDSDLQQKIVRQIEYYFGDINLLKDKFLQEQVKLDDGWIPMVTLLKFNRLAQLSKDSDVIVDSLKKSSNLMEVSEDGSKIRRSPNVPLPEMNEDRRKELTKRTVYCRGFPMEGTSINQLLEFFPQFGTIDNVIMRKYSDKATKTWHFKGSVFVVFSTFEEADSFLKLESVKFNDTELVRTWQSIYYNEKTAKNLKKRNKNEKNKDEEEKTASKIKNPEEEFPRGSVLHVTGLTGSDTSREDLKKAVEVLGMANVAYVDFSMGEEEAWFRLDAEGSAVEVMSKLPGGFLVLKKGIRGEVRVVEGEEEETFLKKCQEDKKKLQQKAKFRNKGNRGGRGRKRRSGGPGGRPPKRFAKDKEGDEESNDQNEEADD